MRSVGLVVALYVCVSLVTACSQDNRLVERLESDRLVFRADIDARELGEPPLPASFSGTWSLTLGRGAYRIANEGFGLAGGTIRVRGDGFVFLDEPAPKRTFNCYVNGEQTFTEGEATYDVTYDGQTLVLSAQDEPCPFRAEILERARVPSGPEHDDTIRPSP